MKWIPILFVIVMTQTGCAVSRLKVNNWNPDNYSRANDFYECLRKSQQLESNAYVTANEHRASGSARTGAVTNKEILVACMNAKGYQLRKITGGELALSLATLPLSVPLTVLGGDVNDFY